MEERIKEGMEEYKGRDKEGIDEGMEEGVEVEIE
jgi:hypothetical protein